VTRRYLPQEARGGGSGLRPSTLVEPTWDVPLRRPRYGIYAYTAREWDPEIGLYFYRARYYDPKLGRFTSDDPIGLWGDGIRAYAYVGNNPPNRFDPAGLKACCGGGSGSFWFCQESVSSST
jgi:RHS repeat-associated protein